MEVGPIYCAEQIGVPPGLPGVLKEYVKQVLRRQPEDVLAWSADYFARLASTTPNPTTTSTSITSTSATITSTSITSTSGIDIHGNKHGVGVVGTGGAEAVRRAAEQLRTVEMMDKGDLLTVLEGCGVARADAERVLVLLQEEAQHATTGDGEEDEQSSSSRPPSSSAAVLVEPGEALLLLLATTAESFEGVLQAMFAVFGGRAGGGGGGGEEEGVLEADRVLGLMKSLARRDGNVPEGFIEALTMELREQNIERLDYQDFCQLEAVQELLTHVI